MKNSYVLLLLILLTIVQPAQPATSSVLHYEYVFDDGHFYVYDLDRNFALVKSVSLPTSGTRGSVACASTHTLFISWGNLWHRYRASPGNRRALLTAWERAGFITHAMAVTFLSGTQET